jgi:hypothetical protein
MTMIPVLLRADTAAWYLCRAPDMATSARLIKPVTTSIPANCISIEI